MVDCGTTVINTIYITGAPIFLQYRDQKVDVGGRSVNKRLALTLRFFASVPILNFGIVNINYNPRRLPCTDQYFYHQINRNQTGIGKHGFDKMFCRSNASPPALRPVTD
uniref:Uncharacterized protein n=1 Tax=Sipha flava TaxID=143950 RepID=A0A2S2QRM4_9HEMI